MPEASTAVGKGHVLLEGGYTFTDQRSSTSQTFPEALLRIGLFTNWFEVRVGQSFVSDTLGPASTASARLSGPQDLYLGVKVAVSEARYFMPAVALIPQMTVQTGRAVPRGTVRPGLNTDLSWTIVPHRDSVEVVIANNRVGDPGRPTHVETATGVTNAVQLTPKLEGFAEWDAFYPWSTDSSLVAQHEVVAGAVYFVTKNLAVDARIGTGISAQANRLVLGAGFAVRR